jgi:hypothetical protein
MYAGGSALLQQHACGSCCCHCPCMRHKQECQTCICVCLNMKRLTSLCVAQQLMEDRCGMMLLLLWQLAFWSAAASSFHAGLICSAVRLLLSSWAGRPALPVICNRGRFLYIMSSIVWHSQRFVAKHLVFVNWVCGRAAVSTQASLPVWGVQLCGCTILAMYGFRRLVHRQLAS